MNVARLIATLQGMDQDSEVVVLVELNGRSMQLATDGIVYHRDGFVGIGYKRDQDATEATPATLQPLDPDTVMNALSQDFYRDIHDCDKIAEFICDRFGVQPGETEEGGE